MVSCRLFKAWDLIYDLFSFANLFDIELYGKFTKILIQSLSSNPSGVSLQCYSRRCGNLCLSDFGALSHTAGPALPAYKLGLLDETPAEGCAAGH